MEQVSRVVAIKKYFEQGEGERVTMNELSKLTIEDREELATLAAVELGVEIKK